MNHAFQPKRRSWNETRSDDERRARITAAAIVAYLYRCGLRCERLPPLPPHRPSEAVPTAAGWFHRLEWR